MSWTPQILIVDDEPKLAESLKLLLKNERYTMKIATGGSQACEIISQNSIDLILLDICMPGMDGYEVMDYVKDISPGTPVIVLTGFASMDSAVQCLKRGAYDYLKKPFEIEELKQRIEHALSQISLRREKENISNQLKYSEERYQYLVENSPDIVYTLDDQGNLTFISGSISTLLNCSNEKLIGDPYTVIIHPDDLEKAQYTFNERRTANRNSDSTELRLKSPESDIVIIVELKSKGIYDTMAKNGHKCYLGTYGVARDISKRKHAEDDLQNTLEKLRKAMGAIIHAITSTVEVRDPYTAGHQQRVANLARAIGREMQLSSEEVDGIRMAGSIHDLGKVNVPAEILSKPRRLTDIEFSLIKTHPVVAYEILKEIEFPWPVADIVYQHHERINGSGYPRGINDKEILLEGKIIAVADVVEAIASHRPYRPALGINKALAEISEHRGIMYDPLVVDACINLFEEDRFNFNFKDSAF